MGVVDCDRWCGLVQPALAADGASHRRRTADSLWWRKHEVDRVKFELSGLDSYDDENLKAELRRVASLLGNAPMTRKAFDAVAKASSSAVVRRFGTWAEALQAAGLPGKYSGRTVSERMRLQPAKGMTDAELIEDLQRVAGQLGSRTLSRAQFDQLGRVSTSAIERRFGPWKAGLDAAGLTTTAHGRRHSIQDYYENMLAVWTHNGRQPIHREMDLPPSTITSEAYEARFGSWRKALRSFVDQMNQEAAAEDETDTNAAGQGTATTSGDRTAQDGSCRVRTVPIGVRYKVLSRDSFRCVLCGASPAIEPGCRLHVDHVVPWSKGGASQIGNLRTLCEKCNLGRGNSK